MARKKNSPFAKKKILGKENKRSYRLSSSFSGKRFSRSFSVATTIIKQSLLLVIEERGGGGEFCFVFPCNLGKLKTENFLRGKSVNTKNGLCSIKNKIKNKKSIGFFVFLRVASKFACNFLLSH